MEVDSYPDYLRDASEISEKPIGIFFADSEKDVIDVSAVCRRNKIPLVFRGAGTGYTGGAVPVAKGLVLSLENLKKLEIDPERKLAFCGPGILTIELMKAAEKHSLFYPPDPASYEESTLGGNVAECAGGLHCKKYGVTKDYVVGLRAITIMGEILECGIYAENEVLNLSAVLISSEGLLAAVTEIAVRLINQEQQGPTLLAAFGKSEDAARAVSEITRRGIVPSVMEYMDSDSVACSMEYEKILDISGTEAVLLMETSGENRQIEAEQIEKICREQRAFHFEKEQLPKKSEKLWKIRRNISKGVKESATHKISEDVCVPPSRLPELVSFVGWLNDEYPLRINSYGHAGDGNLHVNFLAQSGDKKEMELINEAGRRLFVKSLELGGTLSGEHGIGLTKKDVLSLEFDNPTLNAMKMIKQLFDPENLLNPGKMFK